MIETKKEIERGVLVAVAPKFQSEEKTTEYLDELAFLAQTIEIKIENRFSQRLDHPEPRTFVGKGKLEEINEYITAEKVSNVIFDDDLTPSQMRNLERELKVKIMDSIPASSINTYVDTPGKTKRRNCNQRWSW